MKKIALLALGLMLTAASCNIIGGTGSKGILKSTDGGQTFVPSNALAKKGEISGLTANAFTMDQSDTDVMYIGSGSGVHKTTDGAKTWTHILQGMRVGDVEVDPSQSDVVYAAGITGENGRIIKSADGGSSWKDIYTEPTKSNSALSIAVSRANSRVILAGLTSGEILRSVDEGVTWALVRDLANPIVDIEYTGNSEAYALAQNNGLYISRDQGSNWTPVIVTTQVAGGPGAAMQQRMTSRTFYDVTFDKRIAGVIFMATEQGLLRSIDSGTNWSVMSLPVTNETLKVSAVAINPTNSNNLVISVGSTFFRTTNGGVTWETRKLPTEQKVRHILVDPDEPNNIYLGMGDR